MNPRAEPSLASVEEVLGMDGPFSFPEKLLQRLWWRREYNPQGLITADGRRVIVHHPGRWNQLGGPDFIGGRVTIGDETRAGDIEVHLRAKDWDLHGHARDPAYDNVVLHVVLFPPAVTFTAGSHGQRIPVVALLSLLYHDLEEYAADAAVETLANHPVGRLSEALARLPLEESVSRLEAHAAARWAQRLRFARVRVGAGTWDEVCHQGALEILGYRFNRVPMLRVALAYPFAEWRADRPVDDLLGSQAGHWSVQGVRPANRPRMRLEQYLRWTGRVAGWPTALIEWGKKLKPVPAGTSSDIRRRFGFAAMRLEAAAICGGALGGTRLDTLVCDGFIPWLAASGRLDPAVAEGWWRHWFAGDLPAGLRPPLRDLRTDLGAGFVAAHGVGQGLLGWALSLEGMGRAGTGRPGGLT